MKDNISYTPSAPVDMPAKHLVTDAGGPDEQRYTFYDRIEIRRRKGPAEPGVVFIDDDAVSARHCTITQTPEGRCYVRDTSRNGTRLDDRRLVPNIEVELRVGQVIAVGHQALFRLEGEPSAAPDPSPTTTRHSGTSTLEYVERRTVTVLVGDIREYTALVQKAPATQLQASVNRLFARLEIDIGRHGGTVKEHQGDALFAFWEKGRDPPAVAACRAALALHRRVEKLAQDRHVWSLEAFPLRMDWALATGPVAIHSFGGHQPMGLSVIGRPVVLAFRMEKLIDDETGPIVVCPITQEKAEELFVFDDLGEAQAEGFPRPTQLFALRGPR
ncbi:MAG: FHA domain-containing protein [Planctomycetota bacterium]|jgi:class 3 adenylate cyclase